MDALNYCSRDRTCCSCFEFLSCSSYHTNFYCKMKICYLHFPTTSRKLDLLEKLEINTTFFKNLWCHFNSVIESTFRKNNWIEGWPNGFHQRVGIHFTIWELIKGLQHEHSRIRLKYSQGYVGEDYTSNKEFCLHKI